MNKLVADHQKNNNDVPQILPSSPRCKRRGRQIAQLKKCIANGKHIFHADEARFEASEAVQKSKKNKIIRAIIIEQLKDEHMRVMCAMPVHLELLRKQRLM